MNTVSIVFTVALQHPSAVTSLTATAAGATEIDLTWDAALAADFVTNFSVYVSTDYGLDFTHYADTSDGSATGMDITGLDPNTSYMFNVVANNANTDDAPSPNNVTPATWAGTGVVAPVLATPTASGLNGYSLTWTDASTNEAEVQVEAELPGTTQFVTVATLPAGTTTYQFNAFEGAIWSTDNITFRIRALGNGDSEYSNVETGTANTGSFMDTGATTNLSLLGTLLSWDQTGSPNTVQLMVRNVGATAWAVYSHTPTSPTTMDAVDPSLIYAAGGVQLAVETYNLSGGVITDLAVSNIVTESPQAAITAPVITSATETTVDDQLGIEFTYTGSTPTATYAFFGISPVEAGYEPVQDLFRELARHDVCPQCNHTIRPRPKNTV